MHALQNQIGRVEWVKIGWVKKEKDGRPADNSVVPWFDDRMINNRNKKKHYNVKHEG